MPGRTERLLAQRERVGLAMIFAGISILFAGLVLLSVLAVSALAVLDYYRIRRGEVERQQGARWTASTATGNSLNAGAGADDA